MSLRIACDLDGTVADMDAALQREAERLFGPKVDVRARASVITPLPGIRPLGSSAPGTSGAEPGPGEADVPLDPPEGGSVTAPLKRSLTDREMRQLWDHVRRMDNFWMTLAEIEPGVVARLGRTARDRGWELIFLTQRPSTAGDTTQRQSQRWLSDQGFELPSVYVMNGSRGLVANALALDAVIDDRPENSLDIVTDSKALSILVWRADPITAPPGIERMGVRLVDSCAAALDLLERRADGDTPKGFIGRVRSVFGRR